MNNAWKIFTEILVEYEMEKKYQEILSFSKNTQMRLLSNRTLYENL